MTTRIRTGLLVVLPGRSISSLMGKLEIYSDGFSYSQ